MTSPPVEKSGARRVSAMSHSGFWRYAISVRQTSSRLNEQMFDAMPTAIPVFAETSTFGKVVGRSVGSFIVES